MSGVLHRDNALGVTPGTADVKASITFSKLAEMGQVEDLSAPTQRVDVDGVVA